MRRIPATKYSGPDGAVIYRPIIVITIDLGGRTVKGPAIVDSGADDILVPGEAIIPLGLDFSSLPLAPEGAGAGGGFEVRVCENAVLKWGTDVLAKGFKVAKPADDPKKAMPFVLLGRADFFKLYVPTFRWHTWPPEFDLEPVPRPKP